MKKLTLNRETVRNLTHSDLDRVAGGRPPEICNISDMGGDTDYCGGGGGGGDVTVCCVTTDTGDTSGTSLKCCNLCEAPTD